MCRNKRWKRKAKRLIGQTNGSDCFNCDLMIRNIRYGIHCKIACDRDYRRIEKEFRCENKLQAK